MHAPPSRLATVAVNSTAVRRQERRDLNIPRNAQPGEARRDLRCGEKLREQIRLVFTCPGLFKVDATLFFSFNSRRG